MRTLWSHTGTVMTVPACSQGSAPQLHSCARQLHKHATRASRCG